MLAAEALGEVADHLIGHFVDQARRSGASWTEIGKCMGVTKQAAQKRFVPKAETSPLDPNDGFSQVHPARPQRRRRIPEHGPRRRQRPRSPRRTCCSALFADPASLAVQLLAGHGVDAARRQPPRAPAPPSRRDARPGPVQRTRQEGPRTDLPRGTSLGPQLHRHRTHPARPAGGRRRRRTAAHARRRQGSASRPKSSTRCAPSRHRRE